MLPGHIAHRLGELAVEMQHETGAEATLQSIVRAAVELVPGAQWAGVSLVDGKQVQPRVPSDPVVAKLDALQSEMDEGPCLDALREQRTVRIDDTRTEQRWASYCRAAHELDVLSMLCFRLFVTRDEIGVLNLYAAEPGVFDEESVAIGGIFSQHASVAMAAVAADAQFRRGLDSRDVIGQAKGMLMERFNVTGLRAFELLTRLSQDSNVKLVELARQLVDLHEDGAQGVAPLVE